jgi:glyoxylase-like metal-dependent hydrolase (beta-lactamase superfamily II)
MPPAATGEVRSITEAENSNTRGDSRVHPVSLGHANIYLIEAYSGYILVDAGMPRMDAELDGAMMEAGVDPRSVQLIIITHGHLDHIGSIAHAQRATGGKVLCHRSFADRLAKGEVEPAVPQNLKGRIMNLMTALARFDYEGLEPDMIMDEEFDLGGFGLPGKVLHTPGHSPSSVSVILDSGEALVGDMVRDEGSGKIGLGMFYEDKEALIESLDRVAAHEPRIIYLSHGTQIDSSSLREVIAANR